MLKDQVVHITHVVTSFFAIIPTHERNSLLLVSRIQRLLQHHSIIRLTMFFTLLAFKMLLHLTHVFRGKTHMHGRMDMLKDSNNSKFKRMKWMRTKYTLNISAQCNVRVNVQLPISSLTTFHTYFPWHKVSQRATTISTKR